MWTARDDARESGLIAVLGTNEIPALVVHAGKHPECVSADGRSTINCPHVLISVFSGYDGRPFFNGVLVEAVGDWVENRRRSLRIFSQVDYVENRYMYRPDYWKDIGLSKLPDALSTLTDMNKIYDAAEQCIEQARKYREPMTREEYEAACVTCGVTALSDAECRSHDVRYGIFQFPEYPPEAVVQMALAFRRLQGLISYENFECG